MSLVNYIEQISTFKYEIFKIKPDIDFLKIYRNRKILMVGYDNFDTTLDCIKIDDFIEVTKDYLESYNLIILGPKFNYESRSIIKKALKICKLNHKDVVFYGYTTLVNFNLDNSKKMFRPINLEKYPFNLTNVDLIDDSLSYYHLLIYLSSLIILISININYSKILYKLLLFIIILLGIFLPRKHIIYIKND